MTKKELLRKSLVVLLTAGATLAVGFLSFAGMFVLSPSLVLCGVAFVLAAGYESQINEEGIGKALKRIFDPHYLALSLVQNYLKKQLKNEMLRGNIFLETYREQKRYVKELQEHFEQIKSKHLKPIIKKQLQEEQERLRKMELAFLRQVQLPANNRPSAMEQAMRELCPENERQNLCDDIKKKKRRIHFAKVLALSSGIACGFVTLSAMEVGIATFAVLSAIPGGIIVTLSILAGAGYAMLMYRNVCDMIQEFDGKWKNFFSKQEGETTTRHVVRIGLSIIALGLGIFVTIATAGTWWSAVRDSTVILDTIQKIAIALTTLPNFIYNARNALKSIERIIKIPYGHILKETWKNIAETWRTENVLQFFNPFRIVETLFTNTYRFALFLGHVVSMGLMADRLPAVSPKVSTALNSSLEAVVDTEAGNFSYLPDDHGHTHRHHGNHTEDEDEHNHNHDSLLLKLLFSPLKLTTKILQFTSAAWDWLSSKNSFKASLEKNRLIERETVHTCHSSDHSSAPMQTATTANNHTHKPAETNATSPQKPQLSSEWRKQAFIEACVEIETRLTNTPNAIDKFNAAEGIHRAMVENTLDNNMRENTMQTFSQHRNTFFWGETRSHETMRTAFEEYDRAETNAMTPHV